MSPKPSTPAADSDGPKTETTLTTRIRINIPGSRPIPPVVVRKPVGPAGEQGAAEPPTPEPSRPADGAGAPYGRSGAAPAPGRQQQPPPAPGSGAPEPGAGPPSNWFAPRKAGPGDAPEPGMGPATGRPAQGPGQAQGPRQGQGPGQGPGQGQGFGQGPGAGQGQGPGPGQGPGQGRPGLPARPGPVARTSGPGGPGAGFPPGAPARPGPAGPPSNGSGFGAGRPAGPPAPPAPYGAGPDFGGPYQGGAPAPAPGYGAGSAVPPAGPTTGPAHGTVPVGGPPLLDDDTANFAAAQWPGPQMNGSGGAPTSALPVIDPMRAPGFAAPPPPGPVPAPAAPQGKKGKPGKQSKAAAQGAKPAKKAKKGRSKVALLGGGLFTLAVIAYGAGLLLNHSDVPKGTTVFGLDIGGSRDEAVTKVQSTFGPRATAPIKLTVGGKQVELKPEKAGLTLDAQTTVRNAAGSDYNPVTVIGSLLGQQRVAEPILPTDDEKLQVALEELAGTAGSSAEGTIKFEPNKAVAVPGKAGTTLDVDASAAKVKEAFRTQVGTGAAAPVELPTASRAPVVDQVELNRAMKEFAEPAMSGNVTVKAGDKSIDFGPAKSLPKILSMQAVSGKLVEKYDLEALKELYGNRFDGVLITRGTGAKTAVTPQDVAGALGKALRGKTAAERTVTIDTNPS
ncbi:hypothetical protein [Streptomyces sp. G-G2]|uniref:hypothetical protein n=1 Tax=Streptomyces sp. G-G2 TaxID=3046201 RepID=UPI0032D91F84